MNQRLYYLDALRSFCMVYGIFLHALHLGSYGIFESLNEISSFFRMSAFFAVSAFLAVLMFERMKPGIFLKKRMIAFMVPLAFGVLVLNPATFWLIDRYLELDLPGVDTAPEGFLLHLWFLVSLAVYTLLAWPVMRLLQTRALSDGFSRMEKALPAFLYPVALAVIIFLSALALQTFEALFLPDSRPFVVEGTLRRAPFYLLGLILGVRPELRRACARPDILLIAICGGLYLVTTSGIVPTGQATAAVRLLFSTFVSCAAILALFGIFEALVKKSSPLLSLLSRSIYTVYLVHYLLLYAWGVVLAKLGFSGFPLYFIAVGGTLAVGLLLHEKLVERSRILLFLLNGRIDARRSPIASRKPAA